MKAQIVEQVEFSKAQLQSLEFVKEELDAIEAELFPGLDSISFEDIAEDLEAAFEQDGMALQTLKTSGLGCWSASLISKAPTGSIHEIFMLLELTFLAGRNILECFSSPTQKLSITM